MTNHTRTYKQVADKTWRLNAKDGIRISPLVTLAHASKAEVLRYNQECDAARNRVTTNHIKTKVEFV